MYVSDEYVGIMLIYLHIMYMPVQSKDLCI